MCCEALWSGTHGEHVFDNRDYPGLPSNTPPHGETKRRMNQANLPHARCVGPVASVAVPPPVGLIGKPASRGWQKRSPAFDASAGMSAGTRAKGGVKGGRGLKGRPFTLHAPPRPPPIHTRRVVGLATPDSMKVVSYNILAGCNVLPELYPGTPDWVRRQCACLAHALVALIAAAAPELRFMAQTSGCGTGEVELGTAVSLGVRCSTGGGARRCCSWSWKRGRRTSCACRRCGQVSTQREYPKE